MPIAVVVRSPFSDRHSVGNCEGLHSSGWSQRAASPRRGGRHKPLHAPVPKRGFRRVSLLSKITISHPRKQHFARCLCSIPRPARLMPTQASSPPALQILGVAAKTPSAACERSVEGGKQLSVSLTELRHPLIGT
jgi:hypothetical protein